MTSQTWTAAWTAPERTQALIFDCDGTLADTMPLHFRAWSTMLGRYGIPFSEKRFYELGGVPTSKIIQILASEHRITVGDLDAMVHEKESIFLTMIDEVQPVQPVLEISRKHRERLPMAVASGGYRDVVIRTLQSIGVVDWFGAIVCAEDTERHKPEPDVFLKAAERLRVTPELCVVFEDTDIGLTAAKKAGMVCVDVRPWYSSARSSN